MANRLFSQTPGFNHPRRNAFDLSYLNLLTSNFGDLKVCLCKETVPGDLWQCQSTALVRVAPMLAPVMANIDVYIHYFYVPNRLIWSHWNDFITGGLDGTLDPSTDSEVIPPYFQLNGDFIDFVSDENIQTLFERRSLWDSLNLPNVDIDSLTEDVQNTRISSLPFRAYQLVYEQYYEDELLKRPFLDPDTGEDVPIDYSSSGNELTNGGASQVLRLLYQEKRAWGKDYFTTARPNVALTGDTLIPVNGSFDITALSGNAPIQGDITFSGSYPVELYDPLHQNFPTILDRLGQPINLSQIDTNPDESGAPVKQYATLAFGPDHYGNTFDSLNLNYNLVEGPNFDNAYLGSRSQVGPLYIDPNGSLRVNFEDQAVDAGSAYADLSNATIEGSGTVTGGTIRDLKLAIQTYEYDAKGQYGNRPTEWHYNHFGVVVPDATIQRPIYLGGGKTPIMVSEVLQTAGSDYAAVGSPTPQGNMAGHGIGVAKSNRFRHYCEEYGFIIGILSIIPKTAYYQGIPKMFDRWDKLDYYTPEFAHIGEVPVKNQELYFDITGDSDNNGTFGYQSPYADLKFSNNEIHGDFRNSLEYWHTGRKFDEMPALNWEFIHCDHAGQLSRIFAVEDDNFDHFYIQCWHDLKATRLMPKFGAFKL